MRIAFDVFQIIFDVFVIVYIIQELKKGKRGE